MKRVFKRFVIEVCLYIMWGAYAVRLGGLPCLCRQAGLPAGRFESPLEQKRLDFYWNITIKTIVYILKLQMSLQEKLFADYMQAMKDKDPIKKAILNYVIAQIKNKKIELQKDLEDGEVIRILKKEIKSLVEAIGFLEQANKLEELKEEQAKKQVLEQYLPQTKSKEETKEIVLNLIKELGITELAKQRWQVMWALKSQYWEEVEGSLANEIINEMLK